MKEENVALGVGLNGVRVKPEPQDIAIPRAFAAINKTESMDSLERKPRVKAEQNDAPINPYGSQGIQPPANAPPTGNRKAPAPAAAAAPLYTVYTLPQDIDYSPENALAEGLGMVKALQKGIQTLRLGSKMRQEVWERELESLRGQTAPTTLIAVCGATGAGKSSILNAVLDDNIVPTSGMRACTATVTEIAYHNKPTIDADVSFLSLEEWKQELAILLQELVEEDGTIKRSNDLRTDAGVAWHKVHAVYPTLSIETLVTLQPEEIIARDPKVAALFGCTKQIVAKNSKAFASEIAKYIDSKDQSRGKKKGKNGEDDEEEEEEAEPTSVLDKVMAAAVKEKKKKDKKDKKDKQNKKEEAANGPALWPLIRQVRVRCNSKALSTGSILVDLPGVADANAARNNIAKDYMKKCQCIWILAPITRAVDDKTARDLLGEAFKYQLMNGNYDDHSITFIASKCDDIACSEVINALDLEDDIALIQDKIDENTESTKAKKKEKTAAERALRGVDKELKGERAIKKEYEAHLKALKKGNKFTPKLTAKVKAGSKRKNARGGKSGKSKRQKSADSDHEDEEASDREDDDSDSDTDDDSDSGSGSDEDEDEEGSESGDKSGSDEEEDNDDEEKETPESLKAKIKVSTNKIKDIRGRQSEARQLKKTLVDQLSTLKKDLATLQKEKNAFCSLKRSEFSRDVLKADFRTGLKQLDDAAVEEKDPDNFDPTVDIRDYESIDLPVFTCSSRDYVRLTGQVQGDGPSSCFSNVGDTGIPSLQSWCHTLTLSSRQRSAKNFLTHLSTFLDSVRTYVDGIRGVTPADRESLRSQWETAEVESDDSDEEDPYGMRMDLDDPFAAILGGRAAGLYTMKERTPKVDKDGDLIGITPRLTKEFAEVIEDNVERLKNIFHEGLEEKCRIGAVNAANAAVNTVDDIAASMHWQTYRATLRRHGEWRRDLNMELLTPFTKNIAASWGKLFETNLFESFQTATLRSITNLISALELSAAAGLKDRARIQGEVCLKEAKVALQKTIDVVSSSMSNEQKEISRCLAPHVQAELIDGYDAALEERGLGSVKRQKDLFRKYVGDNKDEIFDGGVETIMERLDTAAASVGTGLAESLGQLAQKIEVNLAVLWEGGVDDSQQNKARDGIIREVEVLERQIELWRESEKLKREASKDPEQDEEQYDQMVKDYLVNEDVEME